MVLGIRLCSKDRNEILGLYSSYDFFLQEDIYTIPVIELKMGQPLPCVMLSYAGEQEYLGVEYDVWISPNGTLAYAQPM